MIFSGACLRAYQVRDALKVLEANAQFTKTGQIVFQDRFDLIQSILIDLSVSNEEKISIQHSVEQNKKTYSHYLAW